MTRKLLSVALLATIISLTAFAESKIVKGDAGTIKDSNIKCSVEFDFSKTSIYSKISIENIPYDEFLQRKGDKFTKEWNEEVIPLGLEQYIKSWNGYNKNGLSITDQEGCDYKMVIQPTYLNLGDAAMSTLIGFGAGGDRFDGNISIYHGEDLILVIQVDNQHGKSKGQAKHRFANLMKELGKNIIKSIR